jgi:trk system potassium uptake protein TrkH
MLPPLLIAVLADDDTVTGFTSAFGITCFPGCCCGCPCAASAVNCVSATASWSRRCSGSVLGLFGSLPFMLTESLHSAPADAVFESISGLTTTGATVLTGLDDMPPSILLYRQLLQWLGGIGIIVVAVAVLPMLGIGGMQLYRAETPGPPRTAS